MKTAIGINLLCATQNEAREIIKEVHSWECRLHINGIMLAHKFKGWGITGLYCRGITMHM